MGICNICRRQRNATSIGAMEVCAECMGSHRNGTASPRKLVPVAAVSALQKAVGKVLLVLPVDAQIALEGEKARAYAPGTGPIAEALTEHGWRSSPVDASVGLRAGYVRWELEQEAPANA